MGYWNERAQYLLHASARNLLNDARTVLEASGQTRKRYADLDVLLQQLLLLERLQVPEVDAMRIRNGTQSWGLTPALLALGQQWIQEEAQGIPFNNKTLSSEDFKDMEGTLYM